MIHGEGRDCKRWLGFKQHEEKGFGLDLSPYFMASYLCSIQFDLKPSR